MPLHPAQVALSSLPSLYRLFLSADASNPIMRIMFPAGASPISIAHFVAQTGAEMQDLLSPARYMQIVDSDSGEAVCYLGWEFLVKAGGEERERKDDGGEKYAADANKEAIEVLLGGGKRMREKLMAGKNYAHLATLITSPRHRRKGAASQLITAGLSLADAHHLPTYVEATTDGLPLYLKHGFQKVDTRPIDLRPWGTPIVQEYTILIRPAAPLPPTPSISISPFLTNADFAAFTRIENKAFESPTPFQKLLCPPPADSSTPSESALADRLKGRATDLLRENSTHPSARFIKAFNPHTTEMVGGAKWDFYLTLPHPPPSPPDTPPPSFNAALCIHFLDSMAQPRELRMRDKPYVFMHILAVLPEFQRKGLGRQMLEWGLKVADEHAVECWIDATPAGLGLYKSLGWEEVNVIRIDLEKWGGKAGEEEVIVQLIRQPRPILRKDPAVLNGL